MAGSVIMTVNSSILDYIFWKTIIKYVDRSRLKHTWLDATTEDSVLCLRISNQTHGLLVHQICPLAFDVEICTIKILYGTWMA